MLRKSGLTFVVVGGLICGVGMVNIASARSVMAEETHHKEHKEEEHGMTGAEGDVTKEKKVEHKHEEPYVEHKHKEPKKGSDSEGKTHAEGHKEEEHGMTGAEGEAGKEPTKVEHKHKEPKGGTGGEAETHAEGHKEEEHGMTGAEGEAGKKEGTTKEKMCEKCSHMPSKAEQGCMCQCHKEHRK